MYIVYKHTTPSNKVYIGITQQEPNRRWKYGYGYCKNNYFYKAIQKYGWNNIKHEILCEGLNKEQAELMEIKLIAKYKSNNKNYGYNISQGGELGWLGLHHTKETKHKISKANTGKKRSPEVCEKLSKAFKGRTFTDEWLQKLSESRSGYKMTDEQKKKISVSHDKYKKQVFQYSKTGELIKRWNCLCDIGKELNIHIGSVSECCKGKRKSAGGYCWRYVV